jgi:hypothetical protein
MRTYNIKNYKNVSVDDSCKYIKELNKKNRPITRVNLSSGDVDINIKYVYKILKYLVLYHKNTIAVVFSKESIVNDKYYVILLDFLYKLPYLRHLYIEISNTCIYTNPLLGKLQNIKLPSVHINLIKCGKSNKNVPILLNDILNNKSVESLTIQIHIKKVKLLTHFLNDIKYNKTIKKLSIFPETNMHLMSSDMPKTYSLKMLNILNINNTIEVLKIYVNKEYPEITQYLSKNYKIRALTIYTKYNIIEYTCESDIKTQELSGNCDGIKINKTYHNSQCIKLYDKEYNNESTDIVFSDNDCSYDTNYESGDGSYCSESYDIDTVISEES